MNARLALSGLLLLLASGASLAAAPACRPVLEEGWIRAAPPGATALAGYGRLRNGCSRAFVLSDVRAKDFAMAMIHETRVQNGVSRMRHAGRLAVPVGGVLELAPGGTHMMLMHPRRNLKEGDRVRVELVLSDGLSIPAELEVRRAPASR